MGVVKLIKRVVSHFSPYIPTFHLIGLFIPYSVHFYFLLELHRPVVTLLLHIQEAPGSELGHETEYPA
jgi:hypothetical protein